jgi:hypothetical protein
MNRQNILDNIQIATPCQVSWNSMQGDDQMRHCKECKLSVFNLSSMTRQEAEQLILERSGNLCVRLYRRSDGTVITSDCPKALQKLKDSYGLPGKIAAAILAFLISLSAARAQQAHHTMGKFAAGYVPHSEAAGTNNPNSSYATSSAQDSGSTSASTANNPNSPTHHFPGRTPVKASVRNYSWTNQIRTDTEKTGQAKPNGDVPVKDSVLKANRK